MLSICKMHENWSLFTDHNHADFNDSRLIFKGGHADVYDNMKDTHVIVHPNSTIISYDSGILECVLINGK